MAFFGAVRLLKDVVARIVEFTRRYIECQSHLIPGFIAGLADGFQQELHGLLVRSQARSKSSFVSDADGVASLLQNSLQSLKDFSSCSQCLGEVFHPDRGDHELLKVNVVISMDAAVEHVEQRYW